MKPVNLPGDDRRARLYSDSEERPEHRNKNVLDQLKSLEPRMKEIIKDTTVENFRKGSFIRIYPTKSSNVYDQYFKDIKPLNCKVHRLLFDKPIVPYPH